MFINEIIKNIDFFKNLSENQIELISSISVITKYSSNSILYYESETKTNLLFLVEGLLKIYKVDEPLANSTIIN